jgi:hypothetical protein
LLELSDLLLEPSNFPEELSVLLVPDDDSDVPDVLEEPSEELELPPSEVLAEASLPSPLGGRFKPEVDL